MSYDDCEFSVFILYFVIYICTCVSCIYMKGRHNNAIYNNISWSMSWITSFKKYILRIMIIFRWFVYAQKKQRYQNMCLRTSMCIRGIWRLCIQMHISYILMWLSVVISVYLLQHMCDVNQSILIGLHVIWWKMSRSLLMIYIKRREIFQLLYTLGCASLRASLFINLRKFWHNTRFPKHYITMIRCCHQAPGA